MGKTPGGIYWVNRGAADSVAIIAGVGETRKKKRPFPHKQKKRSPAKAVTLAYVLRQTGRRMEPFYKRAATNEPYVRRFCEAVRETDLDKIEQMIKEASPKIGENFPGTNGIGYFVGMPFAKPIEVYSNGTTIPPGTVQFTFEPEAFQRVAQAVLPLYNRFAIAPVYTGRLARAIEEKDPEETARLVRTVVKDPALRSVTLESYGVALSFRFSFTQYTYRHLLMRESHP
ncbi:MAG: hypothetical protein K0Q90_4414 [Paenibacillaceae bacterium]|nr:hypothetical protein [Paenibacillaceae bacterium]